jgi:hypothetical protein
VKGVRTPATIATRRPFPNLGMEASYDLYRVGAKRVRGTAEWM